MRSADAVSRAPRLAPRLLAATLALALGGCNLPTSRILPPQAEPELLKLAADDAPATFDARDLGLREIRAIAPLPDGGALVATEDGLWRYRASGQADLLSAEQNRYAALIPDGQGGFLAFNHRVTIRKAPTEVYRLTAEGVATRIATFPDHTFIRAVAPGPDGAVRALVMIDRREGVAGFLVGLEAAVWEARAGAEPTKLRDLAPEDAQAIAVPNDEQATGIDAAGRFVLATGLRRFVERREITIGIGLGPLPTAAEPAVPRPTAVAVRLDPLAGIAEPVEVAGHRIAVDGQGNVFGLDAETGALAVRLADGEERTLLDTLPGPTFPRDPGQELLLRAALGPGGAAFLAPELPPVSGDGLRVALAPKTQTLMRVEGGAATFVMGAVGGQQGTPRAGAFDLITPADGVPSFMQHSAVGPDGRIALVEEAHRTVRVVEPGKAIRKITWPEGHDVQALSLAAGGVPWIAYSDDRGVPAPFPANLFGGKDHDDHVYLGRLAADGTIERRATLVEKRYNATIDRLVVRPDGSAFAVRVTFRENDGPDILHIAKAGVVRSIWAPGDKRRSENHGNLHTPGVSLGLAPDGSVEIVAGTQRARVPVGASTAEDLPDLSVNGAHPAVDPAGRLHLVTAGPTITRVADGAEPVNVLEGLFNPSSLTYRLQALDHIGFDAMGHLYLVDRRQQRLFRVPASRLPS